MTVSGTKGYLLFVAFLNTNPVVGVLDINFAKIGRSRESVKDLRNKRERVAIFNRNAVKASVVYIETESSILL